jgi:hypothetical protein
MMKHDAKGGGEAEKNWNTVDESEGYWSME